MTSVINSPVQGRKRIGFVTSSLLPERETNCSFDFFAVLTSEVLRNLQIKYDVVVRVPTPDRLEHVGEAQSRLLMDFVTKQSKFDGLIISPADVNAIANEVVKLLKKDPLPLVTIDQSLASRRLRQANLPVPPSILPDNRHGGQLAALALWRYYQTLHNAPGNPTFIVLLGTGVSPLRLRGFKDTIGDLGDGAAKVIASTSLPFSRERARSWVSKQLKLPNAWKDVVGVFACNDELALGACDALDEYTNTTGKCPIRGAVVGFDGIRDVTRRLDLRTERWLVNTVKVPINEMAVSLASIVENLIDSKRKPPTASVLTLCDLAKPKESQRCASDFEETRRRWLATRPKPRPDIVVITIKREEHSAVLKRLLRHKPHQAGNRSYRLGTVRRADGEQITVAVVKLPEQGTGPAAVTTRDAIEDLDPKLIALVGIGGGIPNDEYSLGDVVVGTRVHAFTLGAYIEDRATGKSRTEFTNQGGPMESSVQDLVAALGGIGNRLNGWQLLKMRQPKVSLRPENFHGPQDLMRKTKRYFMKRFGNGRNNPMRTKPMWCDGSVASSNFLVKDTKLMQHWLKTNRDISVIEMELAGVYAAANTRGGRYPILAVRGLSDIIGFERSSAWTTYACETAAHFFFQILKLHPHLTRDHFFSTRQRRLV